MWLKSWWNAGTRHIEFRIHALPCVQAINPTLKTHPIGGMFWRRKNLQESCPAELPSHSLPLSLSPPSLLPPNFPLPLPLSPPAPPPTQFICWSIPVVFRHRTHMSRLRVRCQKTWSVTVLQERPCCKGLLIPSWTKERKRQCRGHSPLPLPPPSPSLPSLFPPSSLPPLIPHPLLSLSLSLHRTKAQSPRRTRVPRCRIVSTVFRASRLSTA